MGKTDRGRGDRIGALTDDGLLREAVFKGLRDDLALPAVHKPARRHMRGTIFYHMDLLTPPMAIMVPATDSPATPAKSVVQKGSHASEAERGNRNRKHGSSEQ